MIRLSPERSKNGEGREFPLGPVENIIKRRLALKAERGSEFVFTYQYGGTNPLRRTQKRFRRVGDFRKVWAAACEAAGVGKRHIHDFRRSAARRLDQLGFLAASQCASSGTAPKACICGIASRTKRNCTQLGEVLKAKS